MAPYTNRIPSVCPVCGEELRGRKELPVETDESGRPRSVCCPNCRFRMEIEGGDEEDAEAALAREQGREGRAYDVLAEDDSPGEDPMAEYESDF